MELSTINGYAPDAVQRQASPPVVIQPPAPPAGVQPVNASSSQGGSQQATKEQTQQAVAAINKSMADMSRSLEFAVDEDTHMTIVKVVDTQTQDVIRQIPSEEVVAIAKALDKIQGLLIRQQV